MPPWLIAALKMLGAGGLFAAGTEIAERFGFPELGPGAGSARVTGGFGVPHPDVHLHKHKRRRRRALTASDRADIAFISGLLGPKAGKDFAVTIAAKGR